MSCNCIRYAIGNNAVGHCSQCHRTFVGEGAFDAHQVHITPDGRPTCLDPQSAVNRKGKPMPFWADGRGYWHYGKRMAPEVAELRRTAPASAENGPNWHRNYTRVIPGAQGAE